MMVPDAGAVHAQTVAIEAQKELAALQLSQNMRLQKATLALNFTSMRSSIPKDGFVLSPETDEEHDARVAAFNWLAEFFEEDTTMETGQPVVENTDARQSVLA
jgi:hypothetical protein